MDDINYQLNSTIYVAIGHHCYATLIKTDIHLIAFDQLVCREIQLIALTLMNSTAKPVHLSCQRSLEAPIEMIKHHSNREQTLESVLRLRSLKSMYFVDKLINDRNL